MERSSVDGGKRKNKSSSQDDTPPQQLLSRGLLAAIRAMHAALRLRSPRSRPHRIPSLHRFPQLLRHRQQQRADSRSLLLPLLRFTG